MTVSVGDRLPETTFFIMGPDGLEKKTTSEIFGGRKVVLFGVPGAFTPTCTNNHLPGFLEHRDAILDKGVDEIAVVSVNDVFVLNAWAEHTRGKGRITFLSDGVAEFAKAAGLDIDRTSVGQGSRLKRFSMIVEDGVIKSMEVEDAPSEATATGAARILEELG
ncbi:MAG TPA: peroxiredoxin [Afifellaceae bacterium]|nr:peroxiredoxin [Afifellaceae bacterium]